jgi:hypothetical protein
MFRTAPVLGFSGSAVELEVAAPRAWRAVQGRRRGKQAVLAWRTYVTPSGAFRCDPRRVAPCRHDVDLWYQVERILHIADHDETLSQADCGTERMFSKSF